MSNTASIRVLTVADAPAFLALRQRALRDHPEAYHSAAEEWDVPVSHAEARIAENLVFGGFSDGVLVGIVTLALSARPGRKLRHKVEIWNVYVDPAQRGMGLARRLMQDAIAEARCRGLLAIVLSVSAGNLAAFRLYESLGFRVFGVEPGAVRLPDGRCFDDTLMQLDLDETGRSAEITAAAP
ncbi:MAG: GNAT family N-acetyltransferase [Alsobacter sp.]